MNNMNVNTMITRFCFYARMMFCLNWLLF